ncbi:sulfatase-modifying factor protein [Microbacterium sp. No. 7]|nr:sulfatase-modifying factor protein [Microbacterium sp. No. 7]
MDIELARIAGGSLAQGRPRRSVAVDDFELGVFPVTQEVVAELLGEPVSRPRVPATGLSWLRAIRLCNAASEWEGLDSAYSFDGEDVTWHRDADGYRLPTEAEWEFACRAGSTGAHYGPLREIAWTSADGVSSPRPVGHRLPNLNGLFDTLGNVWEWCWDLFDADAGGAERVLRGGSVAVSPLSVRADLRRGAAARRGGSDIGMRLARGAS